ncbi:hypothetical protein M404DRAFT_1004426 [Pisolithus tinctorius Marx 270]|uniref:Uncharacterized protein n=1 Tax=Pisolithus tinctorius Marx 270 TaxID=870435 RepID=A0A0C3NWE9_PISTI|nr:hypothetical protein M404DRAFT_1004426 [Pisolithus tinctorius Marx 270]
MRNVASWDIGRIWRIGDPETTEHSESPTLLLVAQTDDRSHKRPIPSWESHRTTRNHRCKDTERAQGTSQVWGGQCRERRRDNVPIAPTIAMTVLGCISPLSLP